MIIPILPDTKVQIDWANFIVALDFICKFIPMVTSTVPGRIIVDSVSGSNVSQSDFMSLSVLLSKCL